MKLGRAWRAGAAVALAGAALLPACSRRKPAEVNDIVPSFAVNRARRRWAAPSRSPTPGRSSRPPRSSPRTTARSSTSSTRTASCSSRTTTCPTPPPSAWEPGKTYTLHPHQVHPHLSLRRATCEVRMGLYPVRARASASALKGEDAGLREYRWPRWSCCRRPRTSSSSTRRAGTAPSPRRRTPASSAPGPRRTRSSPSRTPRRTSSSTWRRTRTTRPSTQPPVLTLAVGGKTGRRGPDRRTPRSS